VSAVDENVVEFPKRKRAVRSGRDAAFEMLANQMIVVIGDLARLGARVEELEAMVRPPGRADDFVAGDMEAGDEQF
jgi:hypothetical protein